MAQNPSTLPPGTKLGRNKYTIIQLLGCGGFGCVYLAQDQQGTQYAIKQCTDLGTESQMQFGHEIAVQRILNHSVFVKVYDEFAERHPWANAPTDPKYPFVAMEYIPGQSLEKHLENRLRQNQGPFSEKEVLPWMEQLLDGLSFAHKQNIIHRDIKPANIMLFPDGITIKVLDFGIAKIGGAGTKTQGGARGVSPGYSPPEQYAAGQTDCYSDIYAVGATLYHLLTAQTLPESPTRLSGPPVTPLRRLNPNISAQTESVILRAIEVQAPSRYQTAAEMLAALQGKSVTQTQSCPHCRQQMKVSARFCPNCGRSPLPLHFQGGKVKIQTIQDLVAACDNSWQEAIGYLTTGQIEDWLRGQSTSGAALLQVLQTARTHYPQSPNRQLDAILQAADPQRPQPQLQVKPAQPKQVKLEQGDSHPVSLSISNSGKGYLHGAITASEPWLRISSDAVDCPSGHTQPLTVVLDSTHLDGNRAGKLFAAHLELQTNGGRQNITFTVQVTATPKLEISTTSLDFGEVIYGQNPVQQLRMRNAGSGILDVTIAASAPWLNLSAQRMRLNGSQHQSVDVKALSTTIGQRGEHQDRLQIDAGGDNLQTVSVKMRVAGPVSLTLAPAARLQSIAELCDWCDKNWALAVQVLRSGELALAARYLGNPNQGILRRGNEEWEKTLLAIQQAAGAIANSDVALETALRALGAKQPQCTYNWDEIESQLGMGWLPQMPWRPKPNQLRFRIQNQGQRGYLHGRLDSVAPWLTVHRPEFGCFPGHATEVEIQVDYSKRKSVFFSTDTLELTIL